MSDVERLREIAEAATPGPWTYDDGDCTVYAIRGNDYLDVAHIEAHPHDCRYIAAFDPPTVLALLDRLAVAEAEVERMADVEEAHGAAILDLADAQDRLEAAEAKVARVREEHHEDGDGFCYGCGYIWPCVTERALSAAQDDGGTESRRAADGLGESNTGGSK